MAIVWNASYSVGNAEVDRQHQKLFALIHDLNTYHELAGDEVKREYVQAALNKLVDYAARDFEYEETLLEQQGYPGLEDHKQSHRAYTSFIVEKTVKAIQGQIDLKVLLAFLEDWWLTHVLSEDMLCKDYFSKG